MYAVQNDCVMLDGVLFAGSRGWLLPGEGTSPEDERIYRRELQRLELSLAAARGVSEVAPLIGLAHYPPLTPGKTGRRTRATLRREAAPPTWSTGTCTAPRWPTRSGGSV